MTKGINIISFDTEKLTDTLEISQGNSWFNHDILRLISEELDKNNFYQMVNSQHLLDEVSIDLFDKHTAISDNGIISIVGDITSSDKNMIGRVMSRFSLDYGNSTFPSNTIFNVSMDEIRGTPLSEEILSFKANIAYNLITLLLIIKIQK